MKRLIKVLLSVISNNIKLFRIKKIGRGSYIGRGLIINGKIRENIIIGRNVTIGRFSRLGNTMNHGSGIIIEDNCFIGNNFTAIDGQIIIRSNVLIASDVSIFAANHSTDPTFEKGYMNSTMEFRDVEIRSNCWIGEKTIIVPGVTIGEYSIIGAGSVVTKNVPPYSLAVGNPARVIKKYNLDSKKWERV